MPRSQTRFIFVALLLLLALGAAEFARAADDMTVSSPDGKVVISFALKSNPQPYLPGERPYYRVSYGGVQVLKDSPSDSTLKARPLSITILKSPASTVTPTMKPGRTASACCAMFPTITTRCGFPCAKAGAGTQGGRDFPRLQRGRGVSLLPPPQEALEKFHLIGEHWILLRTRRFRFRPEHASASIVLTRASTDAHPGRDQARFHHRTAPAGGNSGWTLGGDCWKRTSRTTPACTWAEFRAFDNALVSKLSPMPGTPWTRW